MREELLNFVLETYKSATIPLRFAYAFWAGFFFLYWYAQLHDRYSKLIKERTLKVKNFPKVLLVFGIFSAFLHHAGIWWDWPTHIIIVQGKNVTFFVLGFVFMAAGLFMVSWARAVLDGYWGPNIYEYKHPEDNILICNGIYSYIRHPVYFGQALMALGTLFFSNSWIFFIFPFFIIIINLFRAKNEEKDLQERFSTKFITYKRTTDFMVPWVV